MVEKEQIKAEVTDVSDDEKKIVRGPRRNQKLKILYLMKILYEMTDETHSITLNQIVEELKKYDVTAERKSIYSDIEYLRTYGIDIQGTQRDRAYYYQVVNRDFELVELKMLVDAVSAARFITKKESDNLIKKLEQFASKYEADQLQRQVNVNGRVKSQNKRVFYSVDAIHDAINSNQQITFQYFSWNVKKEMELRHDGKIYHVSPWALCWDDEKYYLIGYDSDENRIKHFRVDKMTNTKIAPEKRVGKQEFDKLNMSDYVNRMFGMFDGEVEKVELRCPDSMANVIIDRFGTDIQIIREKDGYFTAKVNVAVTDLFIGWVMALKGVRIVGPDNVVALVKEKAEEQYKLYWN